MGKDDKYKGSNRENFNVQKSETYKQRVKKEELILFKFIVFKAY